MNTSQGCLGSIGGALFGALFFIGSFPLHVWNEHRAVTRERTLAEGQRTFAKADAERLDSTNESKLIHLSGEAQAGAPIVDPVTQFKVPALVLKRDSEMYQWDEHSRKNGTNQRRYTYERAWRSSIEDSAHFAEPQGHQNPDRFVIPPGTTTVPEAKLGAYRVPATILQQITATTPWQPGEKHLADLPASLRGRVQIAGTYLYLGKNPVVPEVGDERVSFKLVPPGPISVLARQTGGTLAEYTTSNGRSLVLAEAGVVAPETMFAHAFSANRTFTWLLRAAGAFMMFLGARLIIEPLTKLTDWIPLLGGLVDAGATLAAGVLALVFSSVTIAISWFAVRPLLAGGLIAAAIGVAVLAKRARTSTPPGMPPPPPPIPN